MLPTASPDCCADLRALLDADFFKALSDPTRLEILCSLAGEGESRTISEVAAGAPVSLSVVSRHVSALRSAGIVRCERKGKEVRCTVAIGDVAAHLRAVADALESCCPPETELALSDCSC